MSRDPASGFVCMDADFGWAVHGDLTGACKLLLSLCAQAPGVQRLNEVTLAGRQRDGLLHDGGLCANIDAVHLLAQFGGRSGHRRAQAVRSTRSRFAAMFRRLAYPNGGFSFELAERDATDPSAIHTTNGLAFVLFALNDWQSLDRDAGESLDEALAAVVANWRDIDTDNVANENGL